MKIAKMITAALVVITTVDVFAISSFAQDHAHAAPHGGVVQEADGVHVEMVRGANIVTFYLLGPDGKTAQKITSGKVDFTLAGKSTGSSKLVSAKDNGMMSGVSKTNTFDACAVFLQYKGKAIKVTFKNPKPAANDHGHEH